MDINTTSTTQTNINAETIKNMPCLLPPLKEQQNIVIFIESILKKEKLNKDIVETLIFEIEKLKNSILSKAFKGELGTNDPIDEPQ